MKVVVIRALEADDKPSVVHAVIREPGLAPARAKFELELASLSSVPRSPFAYWVSDRIRRLFAQHPAFETKGRSARRGSSTGNDFWRVRCWWETPTGSQAVWRQFAKGGVFSPFYADVHLVAGWDAKRKTYLGFTGRPGREIERPEALDYYFRPGLTWPRRTQRGLALRAMPAGCVIGDKGPAAFVETNDDEELLALLAAANASIFRALVDLQMAFGSFEVGVIQRTPVPDVGPHEHALATLARRAWSLRRSQDTGRESSHALECPAVLPFNSESLRSCAFEVSDHARAIDAELALVQSEIDSLCFALYGVDEVDQHVINDAFGAGVAELDGPEIEDGGDDEVDSELRTDASSLAVDLVSWCVGVGFGRFDVRLATGERAAPPEPGPFDPLPVCSPGMLTGEDGLPVRTPPEGYSIVWPLDGLLVDDPGHSRDLTSAVREVFDVVFGVDADALWVEAAELVDPKGRDIRRWLAKSFFGEHIRRYSKSRRKAPIYWQLGTSSGSYSVWLYSHRVGRDSLYQVLNDLVVPKLQAEERKLTASVQEAAPNPTASQRKELAAQEMFVEELRVLRDEVARVAPLWNPDLNDGVVIVMAPLWRLVPQLKPWQKELKTHWDALQAGKYDWANLAMHLWPERVAPTCMTDRSLAIAHDLDDVFWEQDADGKWKTRGVAQAEIDRLITERTSPAVKDALTTLIAAPVSSASRKAVREVAT